jgi:cytochrome c peroxidase
MNIFSIVTFLACSQEVKVDEQKLLTQSKAIFNTIDSLEAKQDTKEIVALGRELYLEKALSGNGTQSCESCHLLDHHGAEPLRVSVGAYGKEVERNAPSTFNSGFHISQFWDGRAATLEEQAAGPITAAGEMGMPSQEAAVKAIASIEKYPALFASVFPNEENSITFNNITKAIAAFERTLVTSDRFDDWMKDQGKLTTTELKGLETLINTGCVSCHNGPLLGANSYQKVGVMEPYRPDPEHIDLGRFNVTGNPADKEVFKVPSLRNVTNTAPYFHDGRVSTIEEAISTMARIQLGKQLSEKEIADIVAFLKTMEKK